MNCPAWHGGVNGSPTEPTAVLLTGPISLLLAISPGQTANYALPSYVIAPMPTRRHNASMTFTGGGIEAGTITELEHL